MKNKTIYLVDLENISTRYTCEWKTHVPTLLSNAGMDVKVISGPDTLPQCTSPGAFINFSGTNIYKAEQIKKIAELFGENKIKPNDWFLFTDAWHPGVINLKYMSSLLNIPIKIAGLWHAGNYDKHDFLGRLIGGQQWIKYTEQALFESYDLNCFATEFHLNMFKKAFNYNFANLHNKSLITGWPMEYMEKSFKDFSNKKKQNTILFAHRLAPEKQVDIFKDLANKLPQFNWIICQEKELSKSDYHKLLGESKLVFSAALQETLGIIQGAEGPLTNTLPLSPNRLSYKEIFENHQYFLYPNEWTLNYNFYTQSSHLLQQRIINMMENYESLLPKLQNYLKTSYKQYFQADKLINYILEH